MPIIELPKNEHAYLVQVTPDGPGDDLDALSDSEIKDLYTEFGAVLFRGFGASVESLGRFARRFTTHATLNESRGRVMLSEATKVQSVDPGFKAFPLHPELSRRPWMPDVCFFACLNAPTRGGETTICDGTLLVEQMPDEVRQAFEGRRLMYMDKALPWLLKLWVGSEAPTDAELATPREGCPLSFRRVGPDVAAVFTTPALRKAMFKDAYSWANFIFFNRYLQGRRDFPVFENGQEIPHRLVSAVKQIADKLERPVAWQTGDILMLDNTRFMHGRRAVDRNDDRQIITYFGYLTFARPHAEEPPGAIWRNPDAWNFDL